MIAKALSAQQFYVETSYLELGDSAALNVPAKVDLVEAAERGRS